MTLFEPSVKTRMNVKGWTCSLPFFFKKKNPPPRPSSGVNLFGLGLVWDCGSGSFVQL